MNSSPAWCTKCSIPSSQLPSLFMQWSIRESNKYSRRLLHICNFCCGWSSKSVAIFPCFFPQNPSKFFSYLLRAVHQGCWMNCPKPKCDSASLTLLSGREGIEHCSFLLATVGRPCKGRCNILVPTGTVHSLFYLEAKKSDKALGLLQLGNLAAYHHSQQAYF